MAMACGYPKGARWFSCCPIHVAQGMAKHAVPKESEIWARSKPRANNEPSDDLVPAMTLLDVWNIAPEDRLGQSFFMI